MVWSPPELLCRMLSIHRATAIGRQPPNVSILRVFSDRGRVSPRQASYLSCSHKKRNPKNATRLSASLRFATGKPASRNSDCGAPQLTSRLWRYVQTNGRKPDHEALALFGANAHSLNCVPQAQPHGGSGRPARFLTKLASSPIIDCGSGYQN